MRTHLEETMATIAHFEIPAGNVKRARTFYAGLFKWKFEDVGGNYLMGETSEGKRGASIAVSLYRRDKTSEPILNYIGVPSVSAALERTKTLGGKVITPSTAVEGYGYWAVCKDTEGNTFGLWESNRKAK
jgi:uncharacterized protein